MHMASVLSRGLPVLKKRVASFKDVGVGRQSGFYYRITHTSKRVLLIQ